MNKTLCILLFLLLPLYARPWGFYAHKKINHLAVFLLPPEMLAFYKRNLTYITEHAVDADKRRYAIRQEAPRHYIDIDHYGIFPYDSLPRQWEAAKLKYSEDTLNQYGIVPWYIQFMLYRLTNAFRQKDQAAILKLSADIGHYIGDAHVPLHVSSNHNGQLTNQQGIHGFWESRIPELLAEKQWDFLLGKALYLPQPASFIWERVLQSAAAADTVLKLEKQLSDQFPAHLKFAFEERNGIIIRQYSSAYTLAYNNRLHNMVERRMRQSIQAVAACWYTAWVNAGQPNLADLEQPAFSAAERREMDSLNLLWKKAAPAGRACE